MHRQRECYTLNVSQHSQSSLGALHNCIHCERWLTSSSCTRYPGGGWKLTPQNLETLGRAGATPEQLIETLTASGDWGLVSEPPQSNDKLALASTPNILLNTNLFSALNFTPQYLAMGGSNGYGPFTVTVSLSQVSSPSLKLHWQQAWPARRLAGQGVSMLKPGTGPHPRVPLPRASLECAEDAASSSCRAPSPRESRLPWSR